MKSYREIADSVFARRDQYIFQQRKKKQTVTRIATSVGSVALVSLVGFSLLKSDVFRDTPPIIDGVTATTVPLPATDSTATTPTTSASAHSQTGDTTVGATDTGETQQTTATLSKTQSPTTTTAPNKTESPTTTTAPNKTESPATTTTAPERILVTADEPDTHGIYNTDEGFNCEEPISPLLAQTMEQYSDTDAVYAVLIAINYVIRDFDYYPSDPNVDPVYYNAYHNEFLKRDEIKQLIKEKDEAYEAYLEAENTLLNTPKPYPDELYSDYTQKEQKYFKLKTRFESRVFDFRRELRANIVTQRLQELATLSETEPIHIPFEENQELYIRAVQIYSFQEKHAYSAVLSAEAIRELAEQGNYMFWLDSEGTAKDIDYGAIIDMG